ncbi:type II toxin-antitoxin system ParD family antitoxin [Hansschlegelia zhihuaiae]|uniref:Type II toxin-antitoxin system ParD family antitoxin n=1 Tax=Hansschlegelia zhihuaiae TaxID=405005 RepID=A0A4Q0MLH8_9HYPH|nr:type II toxin-antitoxin system ParD family antitoxin [Hansschlegelia zhihuaiae]RXF74383.1 type II toxin-antitoxin system ParD family antitoxin [Hansschlegelia zhihuaiae]
MAALTVSLTGTLAEFIERRVESGEYGSASDVVTDAVRLMRDDYDRKFEALKAAIDVGIADIEAGRFSTRSIQDIADEVLGRSSK